MIVIVGDVVRLAGVDYVTIAYDFQYKFIKKLEWKLGVFNSKIYLFFNNYWVWQNAFCSSLKFNLW